MSDYIPFEIQGQIMKYLPVKSLVQFRSVSKLWKSLIDSSKFISSHNPLDPEPQHLLVSYIDSEENKHKYVTFLDDNIFPKHKFSPTVPVSVSQLKNPKVIGCSKGLVCLYSYTGKPSGSETVVLWNSTIGKSVVINVPNVFYMPYRTFIGFVVCPRTNDPKLVKSTFIQGWSKLHSCNGWQVEVFSLSSNEWRTLSNNLPDKSIALKGNQEVIDGVIYWLSVDRVVVENVCKHTYLIMSFNITTEEFTKIDLPDLSLILAEFDNTLCISILRDSLAVIGYGIQNREKGFNVWRMENGVQNTFTKLFNIGLPHVEKVVGFLKSGASIVGLLIDSDDDNSDNKEKKYGALFVFVPYSKHIDSIGISGNVYSFFVNSYTESLLLLDQ